MITINTITQNNQTQFGKKSNKIQHNTRTPKNLNTNLNNKKISFSEGTELLFKGFVTQGREMLTSIIEHPVKTAAIIGGTTLGIMALPVIGVPTTVGGAVLAIGFTGIATAKTLYHTALFAKNNHKGSYNIARRQLQQIGEDSFDLALSAPFAPKALTNVKNFHKYGKINLNSNLINNIKSSKKFDKKLQTLRNTDKELTRNINFQSAVDKEISKIQNITDIEKAKLKKELLAFNVEMEKIPQVVLDKWSEIKGIKTQPDLFYDSLPSNTFGCAIGGDCSITLNNFKQKHNVKLFDNYEQLDITNIGKDYMIRYKDKNTGKIIIETIEQTVLDSYNALIAQYNKMTPQAKRILTTVHEREHINQYAQIISQKGYDWLKHSITQHGKELYEKMLLEMPIPKLGTFESMKIESFLLPVTSKTPAGYIKQPIEIGARDVEIKALNNKTFQKLNNIFTEVNKNSKTSLENELIMNNIRIESANS